MKFYSTNNKNHKVSLRDAVIQGLAPDQGLYMPEYIPPLSDAFIESMKDLSFKEIARTVADKLVDGEIPVPDLNNIVNRTIQFDAPLVELEENIFALELFHGPTMAFKDFGARFMSELLRYFAQQDKREITILVATSGDTGSAVANGFLGVPGINVVVLYPSGKVSEVQEKQFTTLGKNITAIEIQGTFDDCQQLVKQAFIDEEVKSKRFLTSANSINIARLIPQSFYYFYAYARLKEKLPAVVFSVPSGNFGNLTGGLFAKRMGLPIFTFIASTNANDIVPAYLTDGKFSPRASVQTISNAMDVGNPSNFARMLDLFDGDHDAMTDLIEGYAFTDNETRVAMRKVFRESGYVLDPHGAVGYLGLKKHQRNHTFTGVFLETAHPGKFLNVVDETLDTELDLPETLQQFMKGQKKSIGMSNRFEDLKAFLMST